MTESKPPPRPLAAAFRFRPAAGVALFLAAGISLRDVAFCRPGIWLICIAASLFLAALVHRSRFADAFLALAILLVGLLAAQIDYYRYPADHIWTYTADSQRFAEIEMRIVDSPRLIPSAPDDPRLLGPKQSARATVIAINTQQGWRPATGAISVYLEQLNPELAAGEIIRATGMLNRPAAAMNPGEFDYAAWERSLRTLAELRVSHAGGVQILLDPGPGPIEWLREKSRHLLARGFNLDQSYNHALLRAFVLGDSDPQLNDLEDQFVNTGTVHCLTISGLHIVIAGGFVIFLGRLLRASPRSSVIAAIIFVILYGLVASPTWPGWRSIITFCAFSIGLLLRRRPDSIQMFCAAIATILLIHPTDLTNGGFQISFAAVFGMILFAPHTMRWFWATWRGPDAVAIRPAPRNAAAGALAWLVRFFISAIGATVIAWLMVIPLIAYHYGQLNTYSAPAGVILLPITVIALLFGLAKIALTLCWPSASHFWAGVCSFPIVCLRHIVAAIAHLPGSTLPLPTPPLWIIFVYYALFALTLFHWKYGVKKLLPAIAVALFFLSPLLPAAGADSSASKFQLTLLSVGDGQCAIIRTPDRRVFLIDAGSQSVSDLQRRLIEPYLRTLGRSSVDELFISDDEYPRLSAASDVYNNAGRPPVYISPIFARHAMGNIPAEDFLETLLEANSSPLIIRRNDHLQLSSAATMEVLWPPPYSSMNANNCGLVLKVNCFGRSILFCADIQDAAERALLRNPSALKCDILIAPHQGSADATTAAFLRTARPSLILASCPEKLSKKEKLFDDLVSDLPFYRTSRSGAVTIRIDSGGNIAAMTFLPSR
jgi:competence protein ComEC